MGNSGRSQRAGLKFLLLIGSALVALAGVAIALTDEAPSNSDDDKQAIINRLAATRSAEGQYIADHPETPSLASPPTFKPTIVPTSWSVGIVEDAQAPVPGMSYGGINRWSWDISGYHIGVYAGSEGYASADPGRGVLMVLASTMALEPVRQLGGWYKAPLGTGALRIAGYEGMRLTVEAATGETFYFDAETREFTDGNGDPVATDSPTPTYPPPHTPGPTIPPDLQEDTPTPTAAPTFAATAAPVGG